MWLKAAERGGATSCHAPTSVSSCTLLGVMVLTLGSGISLREALSRGGAYASANESYRVPACERCSLEASSCCLWSYLAV